MCPSFGTRDHVSSKAVSTRTAAGSTQARSPSCPGAALARQAVLARAARDPNEDKTQRVPDGLFPCCSAVVNSV